MAERIPGTAAPSTPKQPRATASDNRSRCFCHRSRSSSSRIKADMPPIPTRLLPGRPNPLGATWDGLGVNFAAFSAHAERIELCLFDAAGRREIARLPMPECTDEVWHGYLPE